MYLSDGRSGTIDSNIVWLVDNLVFAEDLRYFLTFSHTLFNERGIINVFIVAQHSLYFVPNDTSGYLVCNYLAVYFTSTSQRFVGTPLMSYCGSCVSGTVLFRVVLKLQR